MNIAMLLDMAADGLGDRRAIGGQPDGFTYRELRDLARGVAAGIDPSARALVCAEPHNRWTPAALFGAAWAGVSYAPINFRLPEPTREELVARLEPADIFSTRTTAMPGPVTEGAHADDPDTPAVLLFTSGTSAAPKAAVLGHEQLLAYLLNTLEFASADEDEAALVAVPPFHIAGVAVMLSSTYVGRRVVPLERFDPTTWLATAREEQITHAFLVPTMLARIVDELDRDGSGPPPSLRHLAYGGARMPTPVIERALQLFPSVDFVNAYGLTETSSTVCVLGPRDHRAAVADSDGPARARLSSVGRPVPGVEVTIVTEHETIADPGVVGEIRVRGAQVGGAYLDGAGDRDEAGWLHTADLGWLDDAGYLFVAGRGDGTIIRGGENIATAEIEDALLAHPEVAAVAVVGLPDIEWGEQIAAVVVMQPDASIHVDDLRAFSHARLGGLKTPGVIEVRDELPQTPTGKILHRVVRDQLLATATCSRPEA